ncbi:rab3 GTPase activating protein non catalytic [Trichuris trichiura]|uniref:Rab3 GTPase activating protein non catalytic n=1 Tax=Trichuris trichiura TaxID=36087 RepID=A0A077ZIH8_TRITR|nr:rab3 GTPase activating protein non catalytic [Trichuris trichiura]
MVDTALVDENIFFDDRRNGRQLCFAPGNSYLVAASDSFGRITLWDLRRKLCIYVWKGYRDAQFGWLQVADKNMGNKKGESSHAFLLLAIFAPRLSVLQLWLVRKYRKIAVFKVDPQSHLLYSPPLRVNKSNLAEQCISVCLLDPSGNILFPVVPLASCLQEVRPNPCWVHELKKLFKEQWQSELALQEQLDFLKGMLVSIHKAKDIEIFMDEIFCDAKSLDWRLTCALLESIVAHCSVIANEEEQLDLIRRRCERMIEVVNFYAVISALGNEKSSKLDEQAESNSLIDPFVIQALNEKLSNIHSLYDPDIEVSSFSLPEFLGLFAFNCKELVFKEGISSQQLANAGNFVFEPFLTHISTNLFCRYYQSLLSLSAASWVLMLCSFWLVSVRPYSVTTEQFLCLLVGLIGRDAAKEDLLDIIYKSILSSYRIPEALCLSEFATTVFTSLCASATTVSPSWQTIDKRLILWIAMCKVLRGLYILQGFVNMWESQNPSAQHSVPKEDMSLRNVLLASSDYFVEMFCKYFSIMDPPNNFLQTDGNEWWYPAFTSLKQLFPFQFSSDSLLLNLGWQTASQWHFGFANVQLLALAMQYLQSLSTARLRHCSSSFVWKTYCCDIAKLLFICDDEFFDHSIFEQHGKAILCHLHQLITFCLDSLAQCDSDSSEVSVMPSEDFLCTFVRMNAKPKLFKKQTLLDRTNQLSLANRKNLELHRQLLLTALSACDSGNYSFGNGSALIELFPECTRNIFFNDLAVSVSEDEQPFMVVYQPRIKHLMAVNADLVERTPSGLVPDVELLTELCLAWNIDYDILRRQAIVLMLRNGNFETAFQMLNMVQDQKRMADDLFNMLCQFEYCPSPEGNVEACHKAVSEVRLNPQGLTSAKKFTLDILKKIITYVDEVTPPDWTSKAYLDRIKNDIT